LGFEKKHCRLSSGEEENSMSAYMIVQIAISNEQQFAKYRAAVGPLIERFGGKAVIRSGTVEVLEGHHDGRRMVMFEFPSLEDIHAFWNAPEYGPVKELRRGAATLDIWAVAGV
jgi:uncharacterized protein (DUF1330 family)